MLTDEYVVVVDQLRSSQASLAAEQRRVADFEAEHGALVEQTRLCVEERRMAEAALGSALSEVREIDSVLVPRLSAQAVEAADIDTRDWEEPTDFVHASPPKRTCDGEEASSCKRARSSAQAARVSSADACNTAEIAASTVLQHAATVAFPNGVHYLTPA